MTDSELIREHISQFRNGWAARFHMNRRVLEVGPEHEVYPDADTLNLYDPGFFSLKNKVGDLTGYCPIPENEYDVIFCMEVLEHTVNPFRAVEKMREILEPGGLLLASAPYMWRIHNPQPDAWRFSEHGWRILLKDWDEVHISPLIKDGNKLSPLHYCVSAICNKEKNVDARTFQWRWI